MAELSFIRVSKTYSAGVTAVSELDLTVPDGQFAVLVGPSGCGKTTTLRMVAGLEEVTSGEIRLNGKCINSVPAARRGVAMVFQHPALYPHMTVGQNMEFGLRMRGMAKQERRRRVRDEAARLQVLEYLERMPDELSGGQQQRVALGRALVRQPSVLLMDEPLAHLDGHLRVAMRDAIVELWNEQQHTTLYVTHDQREAMTMGSHLIVMHEGCMQQSGTARDVYDRPCNAFVASFLGTPGMNLWPGQVRDGKFTFAGSRVGWKATVHPRDTECWCGIRPEDINMSQNGSTLFELTVQRTELLGHAQLVYGRVGEHLVVVRAGARQEIAVGSRLPLSCAPERVHWFSAIPPHQRLA